MTPELKAADIYTDFSGLAELRRQARDNPDSSLRAVAQQFESLFIQMMLKSMRDASFEDPLFGSEQTEFYRDMYDQQMALNMSSKGSLGLADLLMQQLGATSSENQQPNAHVNSGLSQPPSNDSDLSTIEPAAFDSPASFVEKVMPLATTAADELGVKPEVLVAQAALETGWGRSMIRGADGRSSYNLFNIKADQRWDGEHASVNTLEEEAGVTVRRRADFRVYNSLEESFADYVRFIKGNPRYQEALELAQDPQAYIDALQRAGYATDSAYANKIKRVLGSEELAEAAKAASLQDANLT